MDKYVSDTSGPNRELAPLLSKNFILKKTLITVDSANGTCSGRRMYSTSTYVAP